MTPWSGLRDHLTSLIAIFLWRMVKYRVYAAKPQNTEDLKQRITSHCRHTGRGVLELGVQTAFSRVLVCALNDGQQAETVH